MLSGDTRCEWLDRVAWEGPRGKLMMEQPIAVTPRSMSGIESARTEGDTRFQAVCDLVSRAAVQEWVDSVTVARSFNTETERCGRTTIKVGVSLFVSKAYTG